MRKLKVFGVWFATLSMASASVAGCKKETPETVVTPEKPAEKPAENVAKPAEKPADSVAKPAEAPEDIIAKVADPLGEENKPVLKLIEAGAEPRQALRFTPVKGSTETASMTMKMNMEMELQGQKMPIAMPPFVMTMGVEVLDVAPSGDFTYKMALQDAIVGEDEAGGANPAVIEQMRGLIGRMKGLGGDATVNPLGAVKATNFVVPPDAPQELKQVMDSLQQSMQQVSVPFPEEAVGVGAKWEVTTTVTQNGMTLGMLSKFELKAIDGQRVTVSHAIVQTAGAQQMEAAGLPPGTKATLVNLNGQGRGEGTFRLDGVMPTTFETAMALALSMEVEAGGQKQAIAIKTDLDLKMTRQ